MPCTNEFIGYIRPLRADLISSTCHGENHMSRTDVNSVNCCTKWTKCTLTYLKLRFLTESPAFWSGVIPWHICQMYSVFDRIMVFVLFLFLSIEYRMTYKYKAWCVSARFVFVNTGVFLLHLHTRT